jgi:hypothetical protein
MQSFITSCAPTCSTAYKICSAGLRRLHLTVYPSAPPVIVKPSSPLMAPRRPDSLPPTFFHRKLTTGPFLPRTG